MLSQTAEHADPAVPVDLRMRLSPARLRPSDAFRLGGIGLRTRPLRAALSALGLAIGIAAMIAVVGISTSSRADLQRTLDQLGTNLLTVSPGQSMFSSASHLPDNVVEMIGRIGPVTSVSAIGRLTNIRVYRNDHIPKAQTGGIAVMAARTDLPATLNSSMADGTWLNDATGRFPVTVLGAKAAQVLGIGAAGSDVQVWLGGRWFTVIGLLAPNPLARELDYAALIGWSAAASYFAFDGYPTTVYTRARPDAVNDVADVLGATANPEQPSAVLVSRPSDALTAQQAAGQAYNRMLLGLGAVALLVGGVGVANTMVISVLERRGEVGLRRAMGATRGHIRTQFLAEAVLLSALGGAGGVVLGLIIAAGYATIQGWPTVVPAWATIGGVAATVVIGGLAGLYPAANAARLNPTTALTG